MAYTAWSVVFGEQPTAAKWNQLGTNDAGFKDGTNIDNLAITNAKLAGSITYDKLASGTLVQGAFMRIYKNATQSIPATTGTTIQFNAATAGYDAALFELNSYGVKILSSRIKSVTVTLNAQIANTHNCILYVYKGAALIAALGNPANDSFQIASITFDVSQNDIIYGKIYDTAGATNITSSGDWNFMTVTVSKAD